MHPIHYPFGKTIPADGQISAIRPDVLWLRMPLPFVLNHVNIWLLKDGDGWSCVDTGVTWDKSKTIWEKVLENHPLSRQIVTHSHPDHVGLSGWLNAKTAAPLWMTQGEYLTALAHIHQIGNYSVDAMLALFKRHGLDEIRLAALKRRGNAMSVGCPILPKTYDTIREGCRFAIGTHEWEVIIGYGHAYEHASLYCADLGIMISGDMLLPSISTNVPVSTCYPNGNPLKDFLDSIRKFRYLPPDTLVLPSHGRPFIGIQQRVDFLEKHHQTRCDLVLSLCEQPQTACSIMTPLFDREINDAHQCQFAMGEAIAHLNYLEQQSLIAPFEKDSVCYFQRM
ncbi:MAG: MBL fold metallo-hydrolase [Oxalobacter sp.]|nr:MBL fold metallo-hydrolase [Oxalobacter sp.]